MVLPDWTDVSNAEGVDWLRKECKIPLEFIIEPLGSDLPTSGSRDRLPFSTLSLLEGGVKFPLDPLLVECLSRWGTFTTQCSANVYRIVMGVCALNRLLELDLGYNEIMYCYSLVRTKVGLSYLQIRPNRNYLVTNLPDSSSGKEKHYVSIAGPLISPDSEFANSFPVGFGNKASKKVNRGHLLPAIRKKLIHQVWQFPDRAAHTLLQYTPRYKSFICLDKDNVPLSPTDTPSGSEKEISEEAGGEPEPEGSRNVVASTSSESLDPKDSQEVPSTSYSSLSTSDSSKTPSAENIISLDSESSVEMERNIPSVKDMLKRKALSSANPKDKRAKVSDKIGVETGKGDLPEDRPPKPKHNETAKRPEAAKKTETDKKTEAAKNTETALIRPPRGSSSEGPHQGVTVWQPKLVRAEQGASRPILQSDTVADPLVAIGLSDVFLLPKDKGRCQGKPLSQLRELGLSHIGQTVNVVSELYRRCAGYEDLLKDAIKKEGAIKSELSKQAEKLKASKKQNEELEGRLKETELKLIKGTRLLTEANEELEKTKAEGRVLTRANSDLKKQVAEFPQKLVAEYNAGADQAMEKAAAEIPELLVEEFAEGFRKAWPYALRMANTDPASDLFNRCEEALDMTKSRMIGEQATVGIGPGSCPPSPAIHFTPAPSSSVISEQAAFGLPLNAPATQIDVIQEKEGPKPAETSQVNPPA